jgi:hypothetical protein
MIPIQGIKELIPNANHVGDLGNKGLLWSLKERFFEEFDV